MVNLISVIIPNYNGASTIKECLDSVFSSSHDNFEVIVVDDCSEDNSVEVISRYPCRLVRLEKLSGAAYARNAGAYHSRGEALFFTDADCLVMENTLANAAKTISDMEDPVIIGGTYTIVPADNHFFSRFQSVFINYSETKNMHNPDYIATHAMVINSKAFRQSGGFSGESLPILEDVEFSHCMRKKGFRLIMSPDILVRHIFDYTLARSLANAFRKSMYWTIYSLKNRDILNDSGTASRELKTNVVLYFVSLMLLISGILSRTFILHSLLPVIFLLNITINNRLLDAFYKTGGIKFSVAASLYYIFVYPLAVGTGVISGLIRYLIK
ncbi:MAG: glycosyltransferase family 2 protein [Nitrospirota bacterium]